LECNNSIVEKAMHSQIAPFRNGGMFMRIITLGTCSAVPTPKRGLASTAVIREGEIFLFDCGEGTQVQIRKARLRWGPIKKIFISHMHGDHLTGLMGIMMSLQMSSAHSTLSLYGPEGLEEYVRMSIRLMHTYINYELVINEVTEGIICDEKEYQVICAPLEHRVYTIGYALIEKDRPGKFDVEKAKKLNIPPGPLFRKLQSGENITLEDGTLIRPEDVLGPPKKGRKIAYCLDTRPCENAQRLAQGADVLIYDGTFHEEHGENAHRTGHSTWVEAAQLARQADVKKLVLTHFSPRYSDPERLPSAYQSIFPDVVMAHDLMELQVDKK